MELNHIYDLWNRFDQSKAAEMELEMNGVRFHLKAAAIDQKSVSIMTKEEDIPQPDEIPQVESETLKEVKAPLVGTFYEAPSPDAEPFVKIGQEIHKGDVIGIIEAMKLMNEVIADSDGLVAEILVEDGVMVEYDQVLITLR